MNQREIKNICIAAICLLSIHLHAQTGKIKKTTSYLMPQVALLNGSSTTSTQIQLAGGLVKDNWHFGLGAGIDYYELRSVPLYTDLRYHFGKEKKAFVYANIGYNFSWVQKMDDRMGIIFPTPNTFKHTGGLYTDMGIGYDIKIGKHQALALSTGFSMKQMREEYEELPFWPWPRTTQNDPTIRRFDYTFKRLSFKVAYQLW